MKQDGLGIFTKIRKFMTPEERVGIFVAEMMGTALLLYLGCFAVAIQVFDKSNFPPYFGGIVFGLAVMMIIQMFGHISGAHLNPAVTMASVMLGYVRPSYTPIYISAQFIGALLGFILLKGCLPVDFTNPELFDETIKIRGVCCTVPHEKISVIEALIIETIITCVLIVICCAVWDKRNANRLDSVALRFGFAVSALSITFGSLTGCSMNTARSFAPALINWEWTDHWIYWIGPNVGGFIGIVFYKFFCSGKTTIEDLEQVCATIR